MIFFFLKKKKTGREPTHLSAIEEVTVLIRTAECELLPPVGFGNGYGVNLLLKMEEWEGESCRFLLGCLKIEIPGGGERKERAAAES